MQVRETTVKELIQGEKQFRVPLFQRTYTWTKTNQAQLWADTMDQYDLLTSIENGIASPAPNHFLGSFVLAPIPSPASQPVKSLLIVDGQQRFITLTLALAAVRDALQELDSHATELYNELYLLNKWRVGEDRYRVLPTQQDRPAYFAAIDSSVDMGGTDPVGAAYRFFKSRLQLPDRQDQPLDLERITRVLGERLAIIDVTTGPNDNVHRIFESLNATGVGLTQADLLRNYIFMLLPTRQDELYKSVWRPMESLLGTNNLEGLARVDLQRRGKEVPVGEIYRNHQRDLDAIASNEDDVEAFVRNLARLAQYYKRLIDPSAEPDLGTRRHLEFLAGWGAQTAHPVLMYAYDLLSRGLCGVDQVRSVAATVESFIVRRHLTGVATNALNWLFVKLIPSLPSDDTIADAVRRGLSGPRGYWATDSELRNGILQRPFYLAGRHVQQMLILQRLEDAFAHPEPVDLAKADLTIEHLLPQTMGSEWRQHLSALGQDPEQVQLELVHTLGNLTLTAFNGTLSNLPIERKAQILESSNLQLNAGLAALIQWGKAEIIARSHLLADMACRIWEPPVPGLRDAAPAGFDWSAIHAAIAALPVGRWTTFGDLAALSGTNAGQVEVHLGATRTIPNAHRVLTTVGRTPADFKWPKSNDTRDVVAVLADEGVKFRPDGAADTSQRLNTEDLAQLVAPQVDEHIDHVIDAPAGGPDQAEPSPGSS